MKKFIATIVLVLTMCAGATLEPCLPLRRRNRQARIDSR
jgi:hypothetical protein